MARSPADAYGTADCRRWLHGGNGETAHILSDTAFHRHSLSGMWNVPRIGLSAAAGYTGLVKEQSGASAMHGVIVRTHQSRHLPSGTCQLESEGYADSGGLGFHCCRLRGENDFF